MLSTLVPANVFDFLTLCKVSHIIDGVGGLPHEIHENDEEDKKMAQFIYEGRGKEQRTGHERIAMQNIRGAINWIVGAHYNDLQDGYEEYLPASKAELANEIYDAAMNNLYQPGCERTGRAPKEMRFAGEAFCRAYIDWKLDQESDVQEIAEAANW